MAKFSIYNEDSLEFLKKMEDNSVDLIITDPPYEVHSENAGGSIGYAKKFEKMGGELGDLDIKNGYDIKAYAEQFRRICKNGMNLYVWCNKKQVMDYLNLYVNEFGYNYNILTWHKTNPIPAYGKKWLTDTEFCLNFFTPGHNDPHAYEDAMTYYVTPLNAKDKALYGHPTCKPVEFLERMVRNSSSEGQVVLDCFMGSGSTGEAALKNNRDFIGIELSPKFYEVSKNRLEKVNTPKDESNPLKRALKNKAP
ncbi:MAG: site-specific DNA-methyltransferase [Paludibacteraceae bacterium]|nr:site-specific DNA-methyltransferase [Paludibacteraceae bacterium]